MLEDLEAVDPAGRAAVWRFLSDIELTSTLPARERPVDEAWQLWCRTPVGMAGTVGGLVWLRDQRTSTKSPSETAAAVSAVPA
ncbi:hypothetical protein [Streptomyces sp. NPDC001508]|uniref:hypothetical protein n=1 Tax=Streptomyces sp. NPDC001508 TaxID=3154656 RepID=UPI0033225EB5